MSKNKSIKYQVQGEFKKILAIGQSHHEAKISSEDGNSPFIHSFSTYKNYVKVGTAFGEWAKEIYGVKNVMDAQIYVSEYLQMRIGKGLSPYTISLDAAALAKLYKCHSTDFGVDIPKRHRADVERSRGEIKNFNESKHKDLVDFCIGTGVRRHELVALKKGDIGYRGNVLYVHIRQGKGGKERYAPVLPEYEKIVHGLAKGDKDEKVFDKADIPCRTPIHKYRAMYANLQYQKVARDLNTLDNKEKYFCRKDKAGAVYDREAMLTVSKMLGHSRISVIAESYLY